MYIYGILSELFQISKLQFYLYLTLDQITYWKKNRTISTPINQKHFDCELGLDLLGAERLSVFVFPAGTKEDEYMIGEAIAGMAYLAELDAKNSKMT